MKPAPDKATLDRATLARIRSGLRMVTVPLPHLSGLAAAMRVDLDDGVPTMGVFESGRLVANPAFTARLSAQDLVFVLAHELLHLALRTHARARGSQALEFNYAHDYIINDVLRHALGIQAIPAGGLDMPGARDKSAEEIVLEMRRTGNFMNSRSQVWEGTVVTIEQVLGAARQGKPGQQGDVLDQAREREMFPEDSQNQAERARAIRDLAAKGMALAKAMGALRGRGLEAGGQQQNVRAQRGIYHTPWHVALQTWLDGVTGGDRSFMRASRRGADRIDAVLPGRKRHSWMLNVILDTSASMSDEVPGALGAIADFCDQAGVDDIRVIQCDTVVTSDEVLSPAALAEYQISGYGGSDLTPALQALAEDPRVTAAIVITDGEIIFPTEPVPYAVLWALPKPQADFRPSYGRVVIMQKGVRAMKVVQELVAYFDRRGKLSRRQLRNLLDQNFVASDAPATMHGLCETVGATYYFRVTGVTEGQLWGTDIYSGDSVIGAAAVHCGLVKPGKSTFLRVTVVTPPDAFPGSAQNGVTSSDFGRYQYAYKLEPV